MAYERYPRNTDPRHDYYNRREPQDYGSDYGSGRSYTYSSARDYEASGSDYDDRGGYGARDAGQRYGQRDRYGETGRGGYGASSYRDDDRYQGGYRGSYASDGRRFEDVGQYRNADHDNRRDRAQQGSQRGYGRQPQGYDYNDRGFFARASDEVRSWLGDEEAERRRDYDARQDQRDQRDYGRGHDDHYGEWRSGQIAALDRDYDEYRRENRTKFDNEFGAWRTQRQGQRDLLGQVEEHMDVVGSDGAHVGTVDKVRGDRILLTKNDADAGGRHHSIPSSWLQSIDDKVTLRKTADEAKQEWRDEENRSAMLNYGDKTRDRGDENDATSGRTLNRSFSGTY